MSEICSIMILFNTFFRNWRTGQPDNGGGDPQWGEEDCAHIGPTTAEWNDLSCEKVMYWICEKKA